MRALVAVMGLTTGILAGCWAATCREDPVVHEIDNGTYLDREAGGDELGGLQAEISDEQVVFEYEDAAGERIRVIYRVVEIL
jgi:hypothetical protein